MDAPAGARNCGQRPRSGGDRLLPVASARTAFAVCSALTRHIGTPMPRVVYPGRDPGTVHVALLFETMTRVLTDPPSLTAYTRSPAEPVPDPSLL